MEQKHYTLTFTYKEIKALDKALQTFFDLERLGFEHFGEDYLSALRDAHTMIARSRPDWKF